MEEGPTQRVAGESGVDLGIPGCEDAVEIGRGGFAVVYRARQPEFNRLVAVKVLSLRLRDEDARSRFQREVRAMGALSGHPHIATVYQAGLTRGGSPFILMELATRGSLGDRLERRGPLMWQEAAQVGVKVAGALEAAHRRGVLHRDVKPENVLVTEYGEPKLSDFGIARLQGVAHTTTGLVTASLAHAAPEVLAGERPGVASDVYSCGSTVFALVAGRPAFVEEGDHNVFAMAQRVRTAAVPDLRARGVPEEVWRAIEKAMAKEPGGRQGSAMELGRELQAAQRACGLPVTQLAVDAEGGEEGWEAMTRAVPVATGPAPTARVAAPGRAAAAPGPHPSAMPELKVRLPRWFGAIASLMAKIGVLTRVRPFRWLAAIAGVVAVLLVLTAVYSRAGAGQVGAVDGPRDAAVARALSHRQQILDVVDPSRLPDKPVPMNDPTGSKAWVDGSLLKVDQALATDAADEAVLSSAMGRREPAEWVSLPYRASLDRSRSRVQAASQALKSADTAMRDLHDLFGTEQVYFAALIEMQAADQAVNKKDLTGSITHLDTADGLFQQAQAAAQKPGVAPQVGQVIVTARSLVAHLKAGVQAVEASDSAAVQNDVNLAKADQNRLNAYNGTEETTYYVQLRTPLLRTYNVQMTRAQSA